MPNDQELDLQEESNWDFDNAEARPATPSKRVVVSVAFARPDFEQVAEYAKAVNMKTSEFIRTAALEKAQSSSSVFAISYSLGSAEFILSVGDSTQVRALAFSDELLPTN